jgi:hypothetical protein
MNSLANINLKSPNAQSPIKPFQILTTRERCAAAFVACIASFGTMSVALLVFINDGNTPWFDEGSVAADVAHRCDAIVGSSRRHQCLRDVLGAEARMASARTMLERH